MSVLEYAPTSPACYGTTAVATRLTHFPCRSTPTAWRKIGLLFGGERALSAVPQRQPGAGHKIWKDANVAASMNCTLPQQLDTDDVPAVDSWAKTTL